MLKIEFGAAFSELRAYEVSAVFRGPPPFVIVGVVPRVLEGADRDGEVKNWFRCDCNEISRGCKFRDFSILLGRRPRRRRGRGPGTVWDSNLTKMLKRRNFGAYLEFEVISGMRVALGPTAGHGELPFSGAGVVSVVAARSPRR
jgi:hypothetical protein